MSCGPGDRCFANDCTRSVTAVPVDEDNGEDDIAQNSSLMEEGDTVEEELQPDAESPVAAATQGAEGDDPVQSEGVEPGELAQHNRQPNVEYSTDIEDIENTEDTAGGEDRDVISGATSPTVVNDDGDEDAEQGALTGAMLPNSTLSPKAQGGGCQDMVRAPSHSVVMLCRLCGICWLFHCMYGLSSGSMVCRRS